MDELEAQKVILEGIEKRKALFSEGLNNLRAAYGCYLKPRIIFDGNDVITQIVIEADPSWRPKLEREQALDSRP